MILLVKIRNNNHSSSNSNSNNTLMMVGQPLSCVRLYALNNITVNNLTDAKLNLIPNTQFKCQMRKSTPWRPPRSQDVRSFIYHLIWKNGANEAASYGRSRFRGKARSLIFGAVHEWTFPDVGVGRASVYSYRNVLRGPRHRTPNPNGLNLRRSSCGCIVDALGWYVVL